MITLKEKLGLNGRLTLLIPYVIIASLFIIAPLVFLVVKAATPIGNGVDNWEIVKEPNTWKIMGDSIWIGLAASGVTLVIGVPFAYVVATSKNKIFKNMSIALMVSPLFIFTIAKAFAVRSLLVAMFDDVVMDNPIVMILGLAYLFIPFMIIPIYSVFVDMPTSLLEASNDLGYSGPKTLFKVVLPYGMKAIISGFAIVFMLAATNIVVSDKMLPKSYGRHHRLIGNLINEHAHPSNKFDIAAASTLALVTIAVISAIYAGIYVVPSLIRKVRGGVNV